MLHPSQQGGQAAQDIKDEVICSATRGRTWVLLPPYVEPKLKCPTRTWLMVQKEKLTFISQQKYLHKNCGQLSKPGRFGLRGTAESGVPVSGLWASSAVSALRRGSLTGRPRQQGQSQAKATGDAQGPP